MAQSAVRLGDAGPSQCQADPVASHSTCSSQMPWPAVSQHQHSMLQQFGSLSCLLASRRTQVSSCTTCQQWTKPITRSSSSTMSATSSFP